MTTFPTADAVAPIRPRISGDGMPPPSDTNDNEGPPDSAVDQWFRRTAGVCDLLAAPAGPSAPGFAARLGAVCAAMIALHGKPQQQIALDVDLAVDCPPSLQRTVLRIALELLNNAVRHGLYARASGRVGVRLEADEADHSLRLLVSDDGWGFAAPPPAGAGLSAARMLARRRGGCLTLERHGARTIATLRLPRSHARAASRA